MVKVQVASVKQENMLRDKTVVITGGGKGIGFAIARKCVEVGAKVLIVGRNELCIGA